MKCFCARSRLAARLVTRYYEEQLRPANLTPAQFELLSTLSAAHGLTQSRLAEKLGLDQTTLSRNLRVLMAKRWIRGLTAGKDKRQKAYSLTASGMKAWREALPRWQKAQSGIREKLGSAAETLWPALERLIEAVQAPEHS